MKNFIMGFLVLAVIGLMAACANDDDGGGDAFTGTWIMMDTEYPNLIAGKVVAANGSWKQYANVITATEPSGPGGSSTPSASITKHDVEGFRGTYTVSGNTINVTMTQINLGFLMYDGDQDDYDETDAQWVAYADLPAEAAEELPPQTFQGTITGNTLSIQGQTFTKQ